MAWTDIDNALVSVGALPFATTIQALRDNPIAIANGDAGAPQIQPSAIPVSTVANRIANQNAGEIGTYAFAGTAVGAASSKLFGETLAGSSLRPAGIKASEGFTATVSPTADPDHAAENGTALSGTWRCMGRNVGNATDAGATLWLRIA
jgi:hypothetical protein